MDTTRDAPSNNPLKDFVRRQYYCSVCKKRHSLYFPKKFAENRSRFPFSYVYLHKFHDSPTIEDFEKDILTTLYIDSNINIRGVDAIMLEDETNIQSKDDSKEIITKLMNTILELQEDYTRLSEKQGNL
jgi:hypothetical protein